MAATARLRHGADLIYFEDGTAYQLADDFTPPGSSLAAAFSAGSSANRYGGAEKIDEKADNRQIDFTVICSVSTKDNAGPQSLANRLITMLTAAGDDNNPVWFEWTLTPDLPEPIWGQFGAWRRAEVVHAGGRYATSVGSFSRNENVEVIVSLTVKPFALGNRNYPASAIYTSFSSISVDLFGVDSFTPTGIRLYSGQTNLINNPLFGNRSSWDTGWTLAGDLQLYENIDLNFVYPGFERSAYLVDGTSVGSFTATTTVSSTAGITQWFSAYVKRQDGAAVTSADCEIIAGGTALATSFYHLGNGVYRATASAAPATSADWATGIQVQPNRAIYLLGFQAEENAYHFTPLICGDMPGFKWNGDANNSTSSTINPGNVGGFISFPADVLSFHSGVSVAFVWKPDYPSTDTLNVAGDFFVIGGSSVYCYYLPLDRKIYLTNTVGSTTTIATDALTFSAGDNLRVCVTMGAAGMIIYVNGVIAASTTAWRNVPNTATTISLGTSGGTGNSSHQGIIRAFEIYDYQLSSTEVTAMDAAFQGCIIDDRIDPPMISANNTLNQFPVATQTWLNYFFLENIAGNMPPVVDMEGTNYLSGSISDDPEYRFSVLSAVPVSFVPTNLMYDSSTAAISVATSADEVLATWTVYRLNEIMGKTVYVAARLTDAGSNLQLDFKLTMGGTSVRIGYASVVADATMRMFYLGPLYIPSRDSFPDRVIRNKNVVATATLYAQRSSGAAANVELDYVDIMPPNLMRLVRTSAAAITTPRLSYYDGRGAVFYDDTTPAENLRIVGDIIQLAPMARNLIHYQPGTNATSNATERTFNGTFYITPRWAL